MSNFAKLPICVICLNVHTKRADMKHTTTLVEDYWLCQDHESLWVRRAPGAVIKDVIELARRKPSKGDPV
jgi:hypothetical protein